MLRQKAVADRGKHSVRNYIISWYSMVLQRLESASGAPELQDVSKDNAVLCWHSMMILYPIIYILLYMLLATRFDLTQRRPMDDGIHSVSKFHLGVVRNLLQEWEKKVVQLLFVASRCETR